MDLDQIGGLVTAAGSVGHVRGDQNSTMSSNYNPPTQMSVPGPVSSAQGAGSVAPLADAPHARTEDDPMPYGESVSKAATALVSAPGKLLGRALGVPSYQSGPLESASNSAVNTPTPVTTSISGSVRSAQSADSQAAAQGISRTGSTDSGSTSTAAAPAPTPVGIARGDVVPQAMVGNAVSNGVNPIDETNRKARAELNVMNAAEDDKLSRQRAAGVLAAQEAQGTFDARNKQRATDVNNFMDRNTMEWQLNSNPRALAAYKQGMATAGGPVSAAAGQPTVPGSVALGATNNYVQNAIAQNEAGSKALQNQLVGKKSEQELRAGEQGIQKGGIEIAHLQKQQLAIDALHAAKTPEEINVASQKLLAMQGKNPNEFDVKPVGGRIVTNLDGTTSTVGGYVAVVNKATGQTQLVGQPTDQTAEKTGGQTQGVKHVDAQGNVAYKLPNGQWADANGKPL